MRRAARLRRRPARASRDYPSRCSSRCSGWAAARRSGSSDSSAAVSLRAMAAVRASRRKVQRTVAVAVFVRLWRSRPVGPCAVRRFDLIPQGVARGLSSLAPSGPRIDLRRECRVSQANRMFWWCFGRGNSASSGPGIGPRCESAGSVRQTGCFGGASAAATRLARRRNRHWLVLRSPTRSVRDLGPVCGYSRACVWRCGHRPLADAVGGGDSLCVFFPRRSPSPLFSSRLSFE